MAIAHLHAGIVRRGAGKSAVNAAAYASRSRLLDERTGIVYDYGRKAGDVVVSFVWLPQGAPERLRDRITLWNEVEARETRKNSRTARTYEMALPHELTPAQQEAMLKDYVRENFTRKGLAVDASIHRPHAYGDQRNDHAHLVVPTRFLDKNGLTDKDRESNSKATLLALRHSWELLVNRHLERYGHAARISMKSLEAQGIDRTPQIHMGQGSSALERKGIETDRGDQLRSIANDNRERTELQQEFTAAAVTGISETAPAAPGHRQENKPQGAVGKKVEQPESIDRDGQAVAWQDAVDAAGIVQDAEHRKELQWHAAIASLGFQQFLADQQAEREAWDQRREGMLARHATEWSKVNERVDIAPTSYQPGTMAEAEQTLAWSLSFAIGMAASIFDSALSLVSPSRRRPQQRSEPDRPKKRREAERQARRQTEQKQEAHSRELEAILQEQARELASYERRREQMLFQQAGALQSFEQQVSDKSSLQQAFETHTEISDGYLAGMQRTAERRAMRDGLGRDGPELG